jgi:hypothetical protein
MEQETEQNFTEIKWDKYGNPIFYPELEIEIKREGLLTKLLKKLNILKSN